MPNDTYLFDGTKSIPLKDLPPEAWRWLSGGGDSDSKMTAATAYRMVPWIFRAVDIRAKAIQKMPFGLYRLGSDQDLYDEDDFQPLIRQIKLLLNLTEAGLCLYGAAYSIVEYNQFGANPTPRWLLPTTIRSDYSSGKLLFKRHVNGEPQTYEPNNPRGGLLYVWLPNATSEHGPGIAPVRVSLMAAGVLQHLDRYLDGYFERGAIRATLLQVDGVVKEPDKKKLEAWWKRLISGVKNAFETVAISSAIKPIVIGDGLKDTVNKELTDQERENIEATIGVPGSLLRANAANYATSQQDWRNLYDLTVVPDSELIEPMINTFLATRGLRLSFDPDQLECFQTARLERAKALQLLAGKQPLLLVDEARAELGYGPMLKVEQPEPTTLPPSSNPDEQPRSDSSPSAADQAKRLADLGKWERKALKRVGSTKSGACTFESPHISIDDAQLVAQALTQCHTDQEVKHLFSHLKQIVELTDAEQALYDKLQPLLQKHGEGALKRILRGETVDLTLLDAELKAAIMPVLVEHVLDQALLLADEIGPDFDPADMATIASEWAQTYTFDLVKNLTDRTRDVVQKAVSQYQATVGMTREALEALLRPAFGAVRAEAIAITEITRSAAQATKFYQAHLVEAGIEMERFVDTNADDKVCVVCSPLDGEGEDVWVEDHPDGAPFHVRCRCGIRLRRKKARRG